MGLLLVESDIEALNETIMGTMTSGLMVGVSSEFSSLIIFGSG